MAESAMEKRNGLLKQAAMIDIEIMKLNDMIIQNIQKAVNLDIQASGSVSDITRNFAHTYHYKIQNNIVVNENYADAVLNEKHVNSIETKSEKDTTPIYLKLPHIRDNAKWRNMVDTVKKNGARYDPDKKAFYITKQHDLNFFADYIPSDTYAALRPAESVLDKLSANKGRTDSGHPDAHGVKRMEEPAL